MTKREQYEAYKAGKLIEQDVEWEYGSAFVPGINLVFTEDDEPVDYDAAVELMDDDIRELLHRVITPCTQQQFFDAYCECHERYFLESFEA